MINEPIGLRKAAANAFYPAIASVEAVDKYTVKFNMTGPDPSVEGYLAWARHSAIIPKDAYTRWNLLTEGVGTGPFKLIQYIPNDRVEYERNPNSWKPGQPYLDKLTFKVLPDIVVLRGLFSSQRVLQFTLMGDGKPWNDIRVRQAISKAIDRQQIVDNVFGGEAQLTGPIPPGYGDWFIPAEELAEKWFKQDLDAAKKLMADAGHADGFDITLYAIANHDATQTAEVVQQQLKELKINVKVISEEIGPFAKRVGDGTFDWCSTGRGMRPDVTGYVNDFGNPAIGQGATWFKKGEGWKNAEMSELFQKAKIELKSEERHKQIRRIQELVLEEAPHIYICQPYKFHAVSKKLKDMLRRI